MTEAEWLACEGPSRMLSVLARHKISERKLRLFGVAVCNFNRDVFLDARIQRAIDIAESYADGRADESERGEAETGVLDVWENQLDEIHPDGGFSCDPVLALISKMPYTTDDAAKCAERIASMTEYAHSSSFDGIEGELQYEHCVLLCDIFGNPFRSITFAPAWRTTDVMLLARGIYDEKAFDRMPILADALQDAGCDNDDILNHCRNGSVHVRGCWVVDLVLEKV
jgi:hypothetical protein